jgi:hypothetical protein
VEASWTIVLTDAVHADAESVMTWWLDEERLTEYLSEAEEQGALGLRRSKSVEDGVRIRTVEYRTAQGSEFHHRMETELGLPVRNGDRFTKESSDVLRARSRKGIFQVRCVATLEFLDTGPERTQVSQTHLHTMIGGTWAQRRYRRRTDRVVHDPSFTEKVKQCEAALESSEGTAG